MQAGGGSTGSSDATSILPGEPGIARGLLLKETTGVCIVGRARSCSRGALREAGRDQAGSPRAVRCSRCFQLFW